MHEANHLKMTCEEVEPPNSCRLVDKLLEKSRQEGEALDESSETLKSDIHDMSMQNSEGAHSLLAATDRLRLKLLSRAAALQVLQSTGLLPTVVNLDTQQAPEPPAETAAPAKKAKGGKADTSEATLTLAIELPKPLSQEVEAALSTAQDAMKALAVTYYSKRDSGRVVTRKSIDPDAEKFCASRQGHFTALKEECGTHIRTEQKHFKHQVSPDDGAFTKAKVCFAWILFHHWYVLARIGACWCRFCMHTGLYLRYQKQFTMASYRVKRGR